MPKMNRFAAEHTRIDDYSFAGLAENMVLATQTV